MRSENKVWGCTIELFRNNTMSVHHLEIKKGGYCSEHKHGQKVNKFYIVEGRLEIIMWKNGEEIINIISSNAITYIHIPIGTWHKFHALTDVKCIEIYDYTYDGMDIERRAEGGLENT